MDLLLPNKVRGDHSDFSEMYDLWWLWPRTQSQSEERITVISITPHPVVTTKQKKSNLKQSSKFSEQSHYRAGRPRDISDESNLEEYQIEGIAATGAVGDNVWIKWFPSTDIEREIQRKTPENDQPYRGVSSGNRRLVLITFSLS